MPRIKHISIPTPCHEDWQQMTPNSKGRHCQNCCKTVVDFTAMSNADVIAYFTSHSNVCGRIESAKLVSINNQLYLQGKKRSNWKRLFVVASLSVLFTVTRAEAQSAKLMRNARSSNISKDSLPSRNPKDELTARMLNKVEITSPLSDSTLTHKSIADQNNLSVMLGGIVGGIEVKPVPACERWWGQLFRLFY